MKKYSFYIAGGDMRFVYLANSLAADGYTVTAFALSGAEGLSGDVIISGDSSEAAFSNVVVLPLPCDDRRGNLNAPFDKREIPLAEIVSRLEHGTVLVGGMVPKNIKNAAEKRGVPVIDYFEREEFDVRNASLTAEAAVALALEAVNESISKMPVLVLGHGRIGRLLGSMLKALDADVTVAARRYSDLAWIRSEGNTPIEFSRLGGKIGEFKVILSTVPATVLNKDILCFVDKGAVIIDLASMPGSIDFEAAEELGLRAERALGLPGKFAPKTAGEIVKETVLNILDEMGEDDLG